MKTTYLVLALLTGMLAVGASAGGTINGFDVSNSSIPAAEILPGGPPRDGIPALDMPVFLAASDAELPVDDRLIGVVRNGVAKAYPIGIEQCAYPQRCAG